MTDISQVEEFMKLAAELDIPDTSNKTDVSTGSKDYAGITPYNVVPKEFYKIGGYAKKVYTFFMPYAKASNPEEEKVGKNVLTPFSDKELDREIIATSIKGYAVEYTDAHEWSEYNDNKYISYCKVIGQKSGDKVTNEPVIVPTKWMYKSGAATGHKVPSDALIKTQPVGSSGMLCSECIRGGFNQGLDTKGKNTWCKEKGNLIVYITHLGVINKKTQAIVYTPVSDIYFASTWDLANGNATIIKHEFLPCFMNLSGSYIQGAFADPTKNLDAIDGFGSFFEKIRKSSSNGFFNIIQWKVNVTIIPKEPVAALSFISDGTYDPTELSTIVQHWKANKPEFVLQEVPFNKFTTELNGGNNVSQEQLKANEEAVERTINLKNF
jgi:hypothetical protein